MDQWSRENKTDPSGHHFSTALRDRAPCALADFGIYNVPDRPGNYRRPCPDCARAKHRPKDDALSVTVKPDGTAVWFCHRCALSGSTARERHEYRRRPLPRRAPPPAPVLEPEAARAQHRARMVDAAKVWQAALPITADDVAGRYLLGRGCCLPHPDGDLLWHPAQFHWKAEHTGPALVALVTDPATCSPVTIHRTWIAPDGSGKAPIDRPRLYWPGLSKGGVVRLWPDDEVTLGLLVGEGIETVLTAARGFGLGWACLDKSNLEAFPVLPGINCLTIVADHDKPNPQTGIRAGEAAAVACVRRWLAAGVEVRVWSDRRQGVDFADFTQELLRSGNAA